MPSTAIDAIRMGATGAGAGVAVRGPKIVTHPNAATDTATISVDSLRSSNREMAMPTNAAATRTGIASAISCVTDPRSRTRNHTHGTAAASSAHSRLIACLRNRGSVDGNATPPAAPW